MSEQDLKKIKWMTKWLQLTKKFHFAPLWRMMEYNFIELHYPNEKIFLHLILAKRPEKIF